MFSKLILKFKRKVMKEGKVKFYNSAKGYGFITFGNNEEIFVHATGLKSKNIRQNDHVQFEVVAGKKGDNAVNVELI